MTVGTVYLVGAGPGDPKLITVRGLELLSAADVVINDRLASPRLLKHARPDAEIVYVGKTPGKHYATQDEIIGMIIDHAKRGKTVVRLKGGDPFVFGRGGEEALALAEAGIDFEVVPGISSSVAAAAYAGIPVTHRGLATSFGAVTGHEAPGKPESDIKWDRIATGLDTIVFLMGIENLPGIVDQLVRNGRAPETPVAVVQWGTTPLQRTVTGTLSDIVSIVDEAGIVAPAVTIVGEVVRLRESISWFENKPLSGKRIVVTRSERQASALTEKLEALGACVDEIPVIKFVPPSDPGPLDASIGRLSDYDWLLFTSANGVEWFTKRLFDLGLDIRALAGPKLAAIGPGTAAALRELHLNVDFVPDDYVAEGVVRDFPGDLKGKQVLVPRAREAREELIDGLRARGADVEVVCVYETVLDESSADELPELLKNARIDLVTFTSASTVRNFLKLAGGVGLLSGIAAACIGPVTADALRAHGMEPATIASEYSIEGLVEAIVNHIKERPLVD